MRARSLVLAAAFLLLIVAPAQILATDGYFTLGTDQWVFTGGYAVRFK